MTVPHDPAYRARLSFTLDDESRHLLASEPVVVTVNPATSRGDAHASPEAAEGAFWGEVRELLQQRFPGWTVWRSDEGRWWATRDARLSPTEVEHGYPRTLDADTPEDLASTLDEQPSPRRAVAS